MKAEKNVDVSVIVPIYNGEKYIDSCLNNLTSQKGVAIEIVVVPNNCTDKTVDLCNKWAQNDNRIRVCVNNEKGTSLARKRGVLEAKGKFITFMDCDDGYVNDSAVYGMYKAIAEDKTDICQFGHFVRHYNFFLKRKSFPFTENRIFSREELLNGPIIGAALGRGGTFDGSVWSKIYKSEVLKSAVEHVNNSLTQQEDLHLNAFAFSDDLVQSASCRMEAYYVYKAGIGISSKPDAVLTLLRDYKVIKYDVFNRMKDLPVSTDFNLRLFSEAVYCYRAYIYSLLNSKEIDTIVLNRIEEIEGFNYIQMAKDFYKLYDGEERNEYIDFLCSDYTPNDYLYYCKSTLPRITLRERIRKTVRGQ